MIILGVDPGTASTGFGIIKQTKSKKGGKEKLQCLCCGLIKTEPSFSAGDRLKKINSELNGLINKYKPSVLAVENIFFFKNLKTALPVSQAKGVILLTAAKKNIPVYEFTPLQVKINITGYGRAEKKQVQKMTKTLLDLKEIPSPDDVADALATAICCVNFLNNKSLLGK